MTKTHGGFPLGWIKAAIMRSTYDKTITKNGGNVKSAKRRADRIGIGAGARPVMRPAQRSCRKAAFPIQ